jgi:hypothetical protein
MKSVAEDLRKTIELVLPILQSIGDSDVSRKPLPHNR